MGVSSQSGKKPSQDFLKDNYELEDCPQWHRECWFRLEPQRLLPYASIPKGPEYLSVATSKDTWPSQSFLQKGTYPGLENSRLPWMQSFD